MKMEKFIDRFAKILMTIGATALCLMMFLTAADVVARYLLNKPISGALELVEYLMAVLIPFGIAYCALLKSHVAVELITDRLPKAIQKILFVVMRSISVIFLGIIFWQNIQYVMEMYGSEYTSPVLLIPTYPFVVAEPLGFFAFFLVLAWSLVRFFTNPKQNQTPVEEPK